MHFYHLHALDWVDVVSALKADPKATAALAQIDLALAEVVARLFRRGAEPREELRRVAASSGSSPTATGGTRPTSCRRKPT